MTSKKLLVPYSYVPGTVWYEAGIHSMRQIYAEIETDALLLVDASNAFNMLNRKMALQSIQKLWPSLSQVLTNCYGGVSDLYVGGQTILSQERTTQGDPLAMPMYAIGIIPLIRRLKEAGSRQVWYADETGAGTLEQVNRWWTQLNEEGPAFGYFPNAEKTWLLVKDHKREDAVKLFAGSGVSITSDGGRFSQSLEQIILRKI